MPAILANDFIIGNNLAIPSYIDKLIITNFIQKVLDLENKQKQILEIEKNKSTNHQQLLAEYDEMCNSLYAEAKHFSALSIKHKKWFFIPDQDFDRIKKLLSIVGTYIEKNMMDHEPLLSPLNNAPFYLEKLYHLSMLKHSPQHFAESEKNQYIKKYTDSLFDIQKEVGNIKMDNYYNTAHLKKIEKLHANLTTFFSPFYLNQEINKLQTSWIRKIFGWLNGQNKKLSFLMQTKSMLPTITTQLASINNYINVYKIEKDKLKHMALLKTELLSSQITFDRIQEIKSIICTYLSSNNYKTNEAATTLVEDIFVSIHQDLNNIAIMNTVNSGLLNKFNFFLSNEKEDNSIFKNKREKIINIINDHTNQFKTQHQAVNFLTAVNNALIDKPEYDFEKDQIISNFLKNKIDQYNAWGRMQKIKNKLINQHISSDEMEEVYLDTLAIVSVDQNKQIEEEINSIYAGLKQKILYNLDEVYLNLNNKKNYKIWIFLKNKLSLLASEKIDFLKIKNTSLMKSLKQEILQKILLQINSLKNQKELQQYTEFLKECWAEKIFPATITIENPTPHTINLNTSNQLPPELIFQKEAIEGYQIAINDLSINANETRKIRLTPISKSKKIIDAILKKRRQFINQHINKLHEHYQVELDFLKTNDRNIINQSLCKLTGNIHTPLDEENIFKYCHAVIDNYFTEACNISEYVELYDYSISNNLIPHWIKEDIAEDVNEIESSLNKNIDNLIYKHEKNKLDHIFNQPETVIDIGRMILQWQFINKFRIKFGEDFNQSIQQAGMDIIYKMHDIATQCPQFLYAFLSSLSENQLNNLEETFLEDSPWRIFSQKGTLSNTDIIGNSDKIDSSGRIVLRKSILFFQVSELVKQELLAYLNNEKINIELFQQHIAFVTTRLKLYAKIEDEFMQPYLADKFKKIIREELTLLNLHEEISELDHIDNTVSFIKKLPSEIINKLSPDLSSTLLQLKYFFANRFKNNIENMLKEHHITEEKLDGLKKLKDTNFYHFIKQILNKENVDYLFDTPKHSMFNIFPHQLTSNIYSLFKLNSSTEKNSLTQLSYIFK